MDVECPFGNFGHKPNVDGKDNDLEEKLQLPDAQARELVQQLDRDTKFLASRGIMDYSLLLGIHLKQFPIGRRTRATDSSSQPSPTTATSDADAGRLPVFVGLASWRQLRLHRTGSSHNRRK